MDWQKEVEDLRSLYKHLNEDDLSKTQEEIENLRIQILGRKGRLRKLASLFSSLSQEEKAQLGRELNALKNLFEGWFNRKTVKGRQKDEGIKDITLPILYQRLGYRHIISQTIEDIVDIFASMGFALATGPEIETEYHNFTALNIDITHPSRDAFDTFYLDCPADEEYGKFLLRSHTSPMQIRIMQEVSPPVAAIVPGRVYRPDAVDASHSFMFHQIEGFFVDKDVKFSDLKGVLWEFAKRFFYSDVKIKFRPHYFPFTEPSAEVDVSCMICRGEGCAVCKGSGWIEVLGCGMIHPKVFEHLPQEYRGYRGFAFGMGVERLCMIKHGIPDIRLFYSGDLRFIRQF